MKRTITQRLVAMTVILTAGISTMSANLIPFTEEYFPDATVRKWIQEKKSSAIKISTEVNPGGQCIDTDLITDLSGLIKGAGYTDYSYDLEDLSCLRYFTKLSGSLSFGYNTFPKLKKINISGLTGITEITNGLKSSNSGTGYIMKGLEEVIADGCTGLTTLNLYNCQSLKTVSIRGCNALTSVAIGFNQTLANGKYNTQPFNAIDLSGATKLKGTLDLQNNPKLQQVRLGDNDGEPYYNDLYNITAANCAIENLNLKGFTYSGSSARTLNVQSNKIRELDLSALSTASNSGTITFYFNGNCLPGVNISVNDIYTKIKTVQDASTTTVRQNYNVGNVSSVDLNLGSDLTYSSVNGATISNKILTFNSGVNTATYIEEYSYYNGGGFPGKRKEKVQITRHTQPLEMWVVFEADGWDKEKGHKINDLGIGKGNIYYRMYNGERTHLDPRWESFRFLVRNSKGEEYFLGGSELDAVIPADYPNLDVATISPAEFDELFHQYVPVPQNTETFANVSLVKDSPIPFCCLKRRSYPWAPKTAQSISAFAMPEHEAEGDYYIDPSLAVEWVDGWTHHGTGRSFAVGSDNVMTGIKDLVDDTVSTDGVDATPAYFNLQGAYMGSELPTAGGIYIKRQGMKSEKILVQ